MKKYIILVIIVLFFISRVNFKNYTTEIENVKKESSKGYNKNYCILIDYSKHSGLNRGFIVNLKTNYIEHSFLVMNGRGDKFSNVIGSKNSSLGMSITGKRGSSRYGDKFKYTLIGLDKSNSNILKRNIVLHSSKYSPNFQIYPFKNYRSYGCPTVSIKTLEKIDKVIKSQKNKKIIVYNFI